MHVTLQGLPPCYNALTLNVPVNLLYGPSRAHILPFVAHMPCVAAREAGFVCLFSVG